MPSSRQSKRTSRKRMTDNQWLRAIAKYPSEERINYLGDEPTGGARELAGALAERVKEAPNRFARLGLRFPTDANPVYLARTLDALRDASVASDLKLRLCHKAFAERRTVYGRAIADVLGRMEDPLPDDAVGMLDWLATRDDDPTEELWRKDAAGDQAYYNGEIYGHGINTTRGRAAEAIADLIVRDGAYIERFRPTLGRMVRDSSAAVRSCVARALRAVAYHDASLGMSLFRGMDLSEDRLLATPHVVDFVRGLLSDRLSDLRPTIERMLRSSEPSVREAGARLACIGALWHEDAVDLAGEALCCDARGRLGVAQVAARNIGDERCRAWCEATVLRLFADVEAEVRRKAASCFRYLSDEDLHTSDGLVAAFCESPAFEEGAFWLLRALENSRERLPGTTCAVCEKYLDRAANEGSSTREFVNADTVVKLVFRTYQQRQNDEWTVPLLELIDRFCLEDVWQAGSELEKFDR